MKRIQGRNNNGKNTSTTGLTAAQEIAETAGDANNRRGARTGGNSRSKRHVNNSRDAGNSSDVYNISYTRAETLATAGTQGTLTAERTTEIGEATAAQETIGTSGTPTAGTPELMETPLTEGMFTTVEAPAAAGTSTTARAGKKQKCRKQHEQTRRHQQ